jgi:hypothetical protein
MYTVELESNAVTDVTVYIVDSPSKMSHPTSVVVLAGHKTANFYASAFSAGATTLTVYDSNSQASEAIWIDF